MWRKWTCRGDFLAGSSDCGKFFLSCDLMPVSQSNQLQSEMQRGENARVLLALSSLFNREKLTPKLAGAQNRRRRHVESLWSLCSSISCLWNISYFYRWSLSATCYILVQVFSVLESTYQHDSLRYLLDYFVPAKHLLHKLQQHACVSLSITSIGVQNTGSSWKPNQPSNPKTFHCWCFQCK